MQQRVHVERVTPDLIRTGPEPALTLQGRAFRPRGRVRRYQEIEAATESRERWPTNGARVLAEHR